MLQNTPIAFPLLRHAHTVFNGPPKRFQGRMDVALSDKGIAQTRAQKHQFDWVHHVVASPAMRVRQTYQYLFEDRTEPPSIRYDADLLEIDNGWFSGKLVDEVKALDVKHLQTWLDHPADIHPGGGESLAEMLIRAQNAVQNIMPSEREGLLVITHGGIIRVLALWLTGRPLNDFHQLNIGNLHQQILYEKDIQRLKNAG
jgi:broad specificity phosphatase PhoE